MRLYDIPKEIEACVDTETGEFVETIDAGGHQRQNFEWFEDFLLPIVMKNFKQEES